MWLNPQETADLVTFTEKILYGKLHFLSSVLYVNDLPQSLSEVGSYLYAEDTYIFYQYEDRRRRSSHRRCSVRKGVLRNFAKFTGKYMCQSLFFHKVAWPATLLKKRLLHRCFPANFAKFLRTPFLQNTSGRLLV